MKIRLKKTKNIVSFNCSYSPLFTPKLFLSIKSSFQKKYLKYPQIPSNTDVNSNQFEEFVQIKSETIIYNSNIKAICSIYKNSKIYNSSLSNYIKIGEYNYIYNCKINKFTYTSNNVNILSAKIGKFCSIGYNVLIGGGNHPVNFISSSPVFYSSFRQCGVSFCNTNLFNELDNVTIGHDVWIGANVVINNGVTIGNGAIIGAGAIVITNVPPYAIFGGVPAKFIRFRFNSQIRTSLEKTEWWNWSINKLRKNLTFFQSENLDNFPPFSK